MVELEFSIPEGAILQSSEDMRDWNAVPQADDAGDGLSTADDGTVRVKTTASASGPHAILPPRADATAKEDEATSSESTGVANRYAPGACGVWRAYDGGVSGFGRRGALVITVGELLLEPNASAPSRTIAVRNTGSVAVPTIGIQLNKRIVVLEMV